MNALFGLGGIDIENSRIQTETDEFGLTKRDYELFDGYTASALILTADVQPIAFDIAPAPEVYRQPEEEWQLGDDFDEPDGDFYVRPSRSFRNRLAFTLAICVVCGVSIGFGVGVGISFMNRPTETIPQNIFSYDSPPKSNSTPQPEPEDTQPAFSQKPVDLPLPSMSYKQVFKTLEPSTVRVTTYDSGYGRNGSSQVSAGSGVLFYESELRYYIATNYHVIEDGDVVRVSIMGGAPIEAEVVGFDAEADLAALGIPKSKAAAQKLGEIIIARFGDSAGLEIGDEVLAIGNSLGEGTTMTNGIVSALDKTIAIDGRLFKMIQTNAAINMGNSGGPLVNTAGEVIGINTAKVSEISAEGVGYSIPANVAKPILQSFMDALNRPYLGVSMRDAEEGAVVLSVIEGYPAELAGITAEDIITAVNGEEIPEYSVLVEKIMSCEIGETIELSLLRAGEALTLTLTLGNRL